MNALTILSYYTVIHEYLDYLYVVYDDGQYGWVFQSEVCI